MIYLEYMKGRFIHLILLIVKLAILAATFWLLLVTAYLLKQGTNPADVKTVKELIEVTKQMFDEGNVTQYLTFELFWYMVAFVYLMGALTYLWHDVRVALEVIIDEIRTAKEQDYLYGPVTVYYRYIEDYKPINGKMIKKGTVESRTYYRYWQAKRDGFFKFILWMPVSFILIPVRFVIHIIRDIICIIIGDQNISLRFIVGEGIGTIAALGIVFGVSRIILQVEVMIGLIGLGVSLLLLAIALILIHFGRKSLKENQPES